MSRHHWISIALLGGMMLAVGCEKSETPTAPAPAPQAPATPAAPSADAAKSAAKDAGTAMSNAANSAATAAKDAGTAAGNAAASAPADATAAGAGAGAGATTAPSAATDAKTAEAQRLLDQALQYIKDNKLDLADKTLTQLEGMKASLPADFAPKIDMARKSLTAAKTSGLLAPK